MIKLSILQLKRLEYKPILPEVLKEVEAVSFENGQPTSSVGDGEEIKSLFPHTFGRPIVSMVRGIKKQKKELRVGVVFSGGQASGGHNVITGLFDALMRFNPKSHLLGFLNGPSGIVENRSIELTKELLSQYRNQGGFDLLGSGRTKIETEEQLASSLNTARALQLDGIVVIGGDDSNTNAAIMAEYFFKKGYPTSVIGVPKTIDGDLKNEFIEISFGFDTATKVYSEMVGNIAKDALSSKKYYHFIKLMGRSASHITLECAFLTQPNFVIIGEEVEREKKTLNQVVEEIADLIVKRAEAKKNYGLILIPEGLIEFIPEMKKLISELNHIMASGSDITVAKEKLSFESKKALNNLPEKIALQLMLDRDPHGNVQVSRIETEKLLVELVSAELHKRKKEGKFNALSHFFGYEGRSGLPTNFDATYCYSLGFVAALLVDAGLTGYMSSITHLKEAPSKWHCKGIPITMLMNLEKRKGKFKPVIKKALVNLEGREFKELAFNRKDWEMSDNYLCPGPIQYCGDKNYE